jgi:hypothetical protein
MTDPSAEDSNLMDVLTWIQSWYATQCDGDWEHEFGVKIDTLDNPGWSLAIDLENVTTEFDRKFRREVTRSEDDWCISRVEGNQFLAYCGPLNLGEALHEFRMLVSRSQRK